MAATKTTFYLSDELRARLKSLAATRGTTVSGLLAEGAELVLARHQGAADKDELMRRARAAERALRAGLYDGASIARDADDVVYGDVKRRRRRSR
jgi:predicted transcriptional regulator